VGQSQEQTAVSVPLLFCGSLLLQQTQVLASAKTLSKFLQLMGLPVFAIPHMQFWLLLLAPLLSALIAELFNTQTT
jgi:hypothetical protein